MGWGTTTKSYAVCALSERMLNYLRHVKLSTKFSCAYSQASGYCRIPSPRFEFLLPWSVASLSTSLQRIGCAGNDPASNLPARAIPYLSHPIFEQCHSILHFLNAFSKGPSQVSLIRSSSGSPNPNFRASESGFVVIHKKLIPLFWVDGSIKYVTIATARSWVLISEPTVGVILPVLIPTSAPPGSDGRSSSPCPPAGSDRSDQYLPGSVKAPQIVQGARRTAKTPGIY